MAGETRTTSPTHEIPGKKFNAAHRSCGRAGADGVAHSRASMGWFRSGSDDQRAATADGAFALSHHRAYLAQRRHNGRYVPNGTSVRAAAGRFGHAGVLV